MKKCLLSYIVFILVIPATMVSVAQPTNHATPMIMGSTLYVGGIGPNNYTKIQDAIDNASAGDTIFVYDDSSPYHESLGVDKPVVLQGENKDTTIIDNSHTVNHGLTIHANNVTVTGFTIQNGGTAVYIGGSMASASYNIVDNNLFFNVSIGVDIYYGDPNTPEFTDYGYNTITNNMIRYTKFYGIRIVEGRNNIIRGNDIAPDEAYNESYGYGYGIQVMGAFNNISFNTVRGSDRYGICLSDSYKDIIYRNTLEGNNVFGLLLSDASFDRVIQNNFINNSRPARMVNSFAWTIESHKGFYPILPNFWQGNYWGKQRMLPYPVGGLLVYKGLLLDILYMNIAGGDRYERLWSSTINYLRFDWHPAQEPYEIR
jgi:parallel beta-helix repeat protein